MSELRDVYINGDGEYRTSPDDGYATLDEIRKFMEPFSPAFKQLLIERTVLIHGVGGAGNIYRKF